MWFTDEHMSCPRFNESLTTLDRSQWNRKERSFSQESWPGLPASCTSPAPPPPRPFLQPAKNTAASWGSAVGFQHTRILFPCWLEVYTPNHEDELTSPSCSRETTPDSGKQTVCRCSSKQLRTKHTGERKKRKREEIDTGLYPDLQLLCIRGR